MAADGGQVWYADTGGETMSTFTHWQAIRIKHRLEQVWEPEWGQTTEDSRDPISNGVNNVRFAGSYGGYGLMTYETAHRFEFEVESSGNLHAAVSMAPEGICFIATGDHVDKREGPEFDPSALFRLFQRMRVGVFDDNGKLVRRRTTRSDIIMTAILNVANQAGLSDININPYDGVISRDLDFMVRPGYSVVVIGLYNILMELSRSARMDVDFASYHDPNNPPGLGLNCPFASISVV